MTQGFCPVCLFIVCLFAFLNIWQLILMQMLRDLCEGRATSGIWQMTTKQILEGP